VQQKAPLFDHLVGAQQDRCRQFDPERLGGLEVDSHLEFRRLLPIRPPWQKMDFLIAVPLVRRHYW
jgi:hypothetical protein